MTTEQLLERARMLSDKATQPGPWTVYQEERGNCEVVDAHGMWVAQVGPAPEDAAFIAESRELVPLLVAEIERHERVGLLLCKALTDLSAQNERLATLVQGKTP